jgi:hypothetical protein
LSAVYCIFYSKSTCCFLAIFTGHLFTYHKHSSLVFPIIDFLSCQVNDSKIRNYTVNDTVIIKWCCQVSAKHKIHNILWKVYFSFCFLDPYGSFHTSTKIMKQQWRTISDLHFVKNIEKHVKFWHKICLAKMLCFFWPAYQYKLIRQRFPPHPLLFRTQCKTHKNYFRWFLSDFQQASIINFKLFHFMLVQTFPYSDHIILFLV